MKVIKKIYHWCTKTRLRKFLSLTLAILIFFTSIKFIFIPAPKVSASDIYLGMNEGYGTTITDGNGNATGTITNAVWKDDSLCKVDKCLYFDGTGDLVNFGDDADLDHIAADNFTIEGWFRTPDITSGTRVLVAKYNSATGTDGGYKVYMDSSGYLIFAIDDDQTSFPEDSASTTTTAFDDNKWHFFSAVKTGTTSITLYVDGKGYQTDSSISSTGTLANTDTFYIGIDGDGSSNGYSGFLDEVKVYSTTARTSTEIKSDLNGETRSRGVAASFGPDQSRLSDGLVGYWKMDETATPATDFSGNGNSGTWNGNTTTAVGKFGLGYTFDGTGDYVNVGSSSVEDNLPALTVGTWLYNNVDSGRIIDKQTSLNAAGWQIELKNTGSDIQFLVDYDGANDLQVEANTNLATATWYHVAVTWDGTANASGVKIYINSVLQTDLTNNISGDGNRVDDNAQSIGLACRVSDGSQCTSGRLDDFRLYNRSLSGSEIAQLYNFAPGPVGHWRFDENTGSTTVNDISGNGNTGTVSNFTNWRPGKFGSAMEFNNANTIVNTGSAAVLDNLKNTGMTAEAWIYPHSSNANGSRIFDKSSAAATNRWLFSITGSASALTFQHTCTPTSDLIVTTNNILTMNTWNHVAVSWTGSTAGTSVTFYLNGKTTASSSITDCNNTYADDSANNLAIGDTNASGTRRPFDGYIDDAKIYNYVRSPGQIVEDMNSDHSAPGSPIGSAVAKWKMDDGYSTTAHDSSINANDLTLSTASWTNSGKYGKAFNGLTNVRLSRADDADLDFAASDDATFSVWFKSDSATNPSANEYILEKGGNITTDAIGYAIYTSAASDGLICFGIDDDATSFPEDSVCSTNDLYDNTWHHIVAKKTGTSRLDLYVDGKANGTPDTSISATGTLENAATFYIGDTNGTDGTDEFLGDIDEVQIFRSSLSEDQIKSLYNNASEANIGSISTDSSNNASNSDTDSYCPPGQGSACTPPVGEWKLDENTSLTAFDTGTNGNNGTISTTSNTPRWSPGVFGSGLRFPGTTGADAVSMGDPANLDFGTNSFTLQYWMKVDGTTGTTQIPIYKGGPSSTTVGYDIEMNSSNVLKWHYGDGTAPNYVSINISDDISPYFGKWVFITCVVDRTNNISSVYFNGRFVTSASISGYGSVDNTRNFQLGNYHSGTLPFYGSLDEIKVYNYARTSAQIAWDMNRGVPVGWWKLDENTGTSANDSIGNSTAGTLTNTPTWTTGKFNTGVSFAGSNQQILIADDSDFDFIDDESMSVTGWFKHTAASVQEIILSKYAAAGYKVIMESDGDITCGLDYDSTWTPTDSATSTLATYDDNSWHHFACVKNGATSLSLYIDGILITTDSSLTASNSLDNADPLYLGIDADGTSNDYTGTLDDIRIYRYPLTVQQIQTVMNNGAALKYTQ